MRALCLVVLFGCTSTRMLSNPTDPRLRAPVVGEGIVVTTTTPWKERVDPSTKLRLRSTEGTWSTQLAGRDLHVDQHGVWIESGVLVARYADQIELAGATPELLAAIEHTRPSGGELRQDGEVWQMLGGAEPVWAWLVALEAEVTPTGDARRAVEMCMDRQACLALDDGRVEQVRAHFAALAAPLAEIRIHTAQQGWGAPLYSSRLIDALRAGVTSKLGWRWERVASIEVENLSGGKTLAAILGTAVAAIVVVPAAFIMRAGNAAQGRGTRNEVSFVGDTLTRLAQANTGWAARGTWAPELATTESSHAKPMFATGANVRAIVRPTLAIDTGAAKAGDLVGTGLIAKLRIKDVFEIGGGVRVVGTRDERGWRSSITHVFAMGTHLPLDAGRRFALPIGFEASGGGAVAHDVRVPWGVRYTPHGGRWFGTLQPATPAWMRTTSERTGRWTLNSSLELGVTF